MSQVVIATVLVTDNMCGAQHQQTVNQSLKSAGKSLGRLVATVVSLQLRGPERQQVHGFDDQRPR